MSDEKETVNVTDAFANFLESIAGAIKPQTYVLGEDEEELGETRETNSVISEWIVTLNWTDLETGDCYTTWFDSGILQSHQIGLLITVLDAIRAS